MRLIDADEQFCEEASDGTGYVLTYDGGMYAVTNEFGHTVCEFLPEQPTVDAAPEWISVKDGLPKDRKSVNVAVEHKRDDGKTFQFVMTASHIGYHEIEAEEWPDYDGDTEYDEENDCYWIPENWYEDNFMEDNMNYLICDEYRVTHWMPLPELPKEGGDGE